MSFPERVMSAPIPVSRKNFILAVVIGLFCLLLVGGSIVGVVLFSGSFAEVVQNIEEKETASTGEITPDKARLIASQKWRTLDGKDFTLYYPPGQNENEAVQFLHGLEGTLPKVCTALKLKTPDGKISVFLFPDAAAHGRVSQTEPDDSAYSYGDCITTVYEPWPQIRGTMAHELGHVVAELRLAANVYGLMDEGLAEYVEEQAAGDTDEVQAVITSSIPLRALARWEIFYDWEIAEEGSGSNLSHYHHAHALVKYLITQYGMERFQRCYRLLGRGAEKADRDEGQQLSDAIQEAYGKTLAELEHEWRQSDKVQVLREGLRTL